MGFGATVLCIVSVLLLNGNEVHGFALQLVLMISSGVI